MATPRDAILQDYMAEAVLRRKASFISVVTLGRDTHYDPVKHTLLPRRGVDTSEAYTDAESALRRGYASRHPDKPVDMQSDTTVDLDGTTVSHVMSITKAMMGSLWAYYIYNRDGRHAYMKPMLLGRHGADNAKLKMFLSPHHQMLSLPHLGDAMMRRFLVQNTGLITKSTDAIDILAVLSFLTYRPSELGPPVAHPQNFDSLLIEDYVAAPVPKRPPFEYNDKLTQVAACALEDHVRTMTGNEKFSIAEEVSTIFFPKRVHDQPHIQMWPRIEAGFNTRSGKPVYHTLGFFGLRMCGRDMVEVGVNYLLHHHRLLMQLYEEPTELCYDIGYQPEDIKKEGVEASRSGWRYNCFWWIPMLENDIDHRWVAAIGHEGQYILFELNSRTVFVRQHFKKTGPLLQNVDIKHVVNADAVRHPTFVHDAKVLLDKLGI